LPICHPAEPEFATGSERAVWEALREQLGDADLLVAGLRVSDHSKDHEIDIAVVFADLGVVVVEVKGGTITHDGTTWLQPWNGALKSIDPVKQARDAKYALRDYVEHDPRWGSRGRLRWAHAVALPYTGVDDGFAVPDCPRWSVAGRQDVPRLAVFLRRALAAQQSPNRLATYDDVVAVHDILLGRLHPQRDLIGEATEREDRADRLTQQQALVLDAIRLIHRVEVRGGAGSGKTWLAVEQVRRLSRSGKRVALLCYSRGLAAFLQRRVDTMRRQEQPAYVGTFHGLGAAWGATPGSDDDSDYWERRLPEQMIELADRLGAGHRFDAVVVDEAQDFADAWWPALLASLRDEEASGVYVFSDEGQRVFTRFGGAPIPLTPLVRDHNLRNTRQIGETFGTLATIRMRLMGGDGPVVRFVPCPADEAVDHADDQIDALVDDGWRPEDLALLTTGSRHPEQVARQSRGQDAYWASFWDADQVFYGHVLGFKGLERRAVVLALNEAQPRERSRERLYVGLSRARDQLVVCGDPEYVEAVGGRAVLRSLTSESRGFSR
jgi:hypothetical protein